MGRMNSEDQNIPPPKWTGHSLAGFLKGNLEGLREILIFRCTESFTENRNNETRLTRYHSPSPGFVIRSVHAMLGFVSYFKGKFLNKSNTGHKTFHAFLLGIWSKSSLPASLTLTLQLVKLLLIKCNAAPGKKMPFFKWKSLSCLFFSLSGHWLDNTLSRVGWAPSIPPQAVDGKPPAPERISPSFPIYVLWTMQERSVRCKIDIYLPPYHISW